MPDAGPILPGMAVHVIDGALEGLQGTCAAVTGDRRAHVLIALLGQMVRVKIAVDQLIPVDRISEKQSKQKP